MSNSVNTSTQSLRGRIAAFVASLVCLWGLAVAMPVYAGADGGEPININTADAQALAGALTGVGLSKAEAIVKYRKAYGDFESIEELTAVKDIGESLLEKNRGQIILK